MHRKHLLLLASALALIFPSAHTSRGQATGPTHAAWSWQEPYAEVDGKGDLAWKPRQFLFEKGASVRYIDYDGGDDTNSGEVREKPWKHHPWDAHAGGNSA